MQISSEIFLTYDIIRTAIFSLLGLFLGIIITLAAEFFFHKLKKNSPVKCNLSRTQRAAEALKELKEKKRNISSELKQNQDEEKNSLLSHLKNNKETMKEENNNEEEYDEEYITEDEDEEIETSEEEEEDSEFERMEELQLKMILLVRRDGKKLNTQAIATLAASAAVGVIQKIQNNSEEIKNNLKQLQWLEWLLWWNKVGCAKITLKVPDNETLKKIILEVETAGLPCFSVNSLLINEKEESHQPKREIKGEVKGENVVVAIGPAPAALLNPITGNLKLLS